MEEIISFKKIFFLNKNKIIALKEIFKSVESLNGEFCLQPYTCCLLIILFPPVWIQCGSGSTTLNIKIANITVLRSRSRWSRNYLRPGAGAGIIFLINISCSQFGGCLDVENPTFLWYHCYSTVISGNIWQELELEPEPK